MGVWFDDEQLAVLRAAADRVIPPDPGSGVPGGADSGVADYVDQLLGAFRFDPPRVWAGGPYSGRHGGDASFERWIALTPADELAWRLRLEGSAGRPEREFNGPVVGWQQRYAEGLAALGPDFAELDAADADARLAAAPDDFRGLLYEHACEATYGDPIYGGNRDGVGWQSIGFAGDVQPRGWTDAEVAGP